MSIDWIFNCISLSFFITFSGDEKVLAGMKQFAELTDEATKAIKNHDWSTLADLMNANFGLRRELYGDAALGVDNLRMIEIGRSFGAAVKFPGSGGAVLGLLNDQSRMVGL